MKMLGWMLISLTVAAHAQQIDDTSKTVTANAEQSADTSHWKHIVVAGFTGTQVAYSDWVQGGENAIAWDAALDGKSIYVLPTYVWTTTRTILAMGIRDWEPRVPEIRTIRSILPLN